MPIAMVIEGYGIIVVDKKGQLLWEWTHPGVSGLDVDPETGNFYVSTHNRVLEVTRTGRVVWQYEVKKGRTLGLKYLPEWKVDYTEEEQKIIEERLRRLGYIE